MTTLRTFLSPRGLSVIIAAVLIAFIQNCGAAQPAPCHEVTISYDGREYQYTVGGIDYYWWNYTVTGDPCITRALSYWVLEICPDFLMVVTDISTLSVDSSDPANGDSTYYDTEIGTDSKTGLTGVKWEHSWGNELDSPGEYDTFSFVSPGVEDPDSPVKWVSKSNQLFDAGYTVGPGCLPSNRGACCGPWGSVACIQAYESWCIKQGGIYMGDGTVCGGGICATPVERGSWGRIKALYR